MDSRHHLHSQRPLVLGSASLTQALHQTNCLHCYSTLYRHPRFPQCVLVCGLHPWRVLQQRVPPRIPGSGFGVLVFGDWDHLCGSWW